MYESAELNAAVLKARADHVQAVLQEQSRQRSSGGGPLDWNELAKAVSHRSTWAMRQASRLAMNDALEARDVWDMDSLCSSNGSNYLKRFSMPFYNSNELPNCTTTTLRRLSLPMGSSIYNTTTASTATTSTTTRRNSVDVQKLKEMNRQFLKSVTGSQNGMHTKNPASSSLAPHSNSLSLMLVRGRRMAMQQQQGNAPSPRALMAGLADSTTLSLGQALRRDSLHGLIRESTRDL